MALEPILVYRAAVDAGFKYGHGLDIAVAVAFAENYDTTTGTLDENRVFLNPDGSRDRGIWQINEKAHPEVSDACAFDHRCAAKQAFRISKEGKDFGAWSAYNNWRYRYYMPAARALRQLGEAQTAVLEAKDVLSKVHIVP